jgi:hypothetical protein
MLIEIAALLEGVLFTCAWVRRSRTQQCQVLMGKKDSTRLLMLDDYLKRQTAGASHLEIFAASQLAAVCRKAVQTRSFESVLLYGIRSARSRKRSTSTWRINL